MNYIFFDDTEIRTSLLPITFTRPVANIRIGILTIAEKWNYYLGNKGSFKTEYYLQKKFPIKIEARNNIYINGAVCPTPNLIQNVKQLKPGQSLISSKTLVAYCDTTGQSDIHYEGPLNIIRHLWDIFRLNSEEINNDYLLITHNRKSLDVKDPFTRVYCPENIFVEEGVKIRAAVLNAENGPIYLGKDAQVHEGALIKGPFALCEGSHINMGAKIRGDSTIGPYCKVGGEISNSVFFGYSNKAHDGFVGNTIIGEWCNLGADTNTSNLKNNYGEVEIYSYEHRAPIKTGLQFCGLIMGDHSKSGINTMFNTGTVIGVNANVFGGGYPPKFIPSFSWGGSQGFETFSLEKSYEVAERVMSRRNLKFDETEKEIFREIFKIIKG